MVLRFYLEAQEDYEQYMSLSYEEIDSLFMAEYQTGVFDGVFPYLKAGRAKALKEKGKKSKKYTEYLNYLGFFYMVANQSDLSLPLLIEAKDLRQEIFGENQPEYAETLYYLANYYKSSGDMDLAKSLLVQSKDIYEKSEEQSSTNYREVITLLGQVHQSQGNLKGSLECHQITSELNEKAFGKMSAEYATSLHYIAYVYYALEDIDRAIRILKEGKDIRGKVLGKEHPYYGGSLAELASIYTTKGDYEKALPLLLEGRDIRLRTVGRKHMYMVMATESLAQLYLRMEKYEECWKTIEELYDLCSRTEVEHDFSPQWIETLSNANYPSHQHRMFMEGALVHTFNLIGRDTKMSGDRIAKRRAVATLANQLLATARDNLVNEGDKLRVLQRSDYWLRMTLNIFDNAGSEDLAFNLLERNKSVLLLQATNAEAAYQMGNLPDSIIQKDQNLKKQKDELRAKLSEDQPKEQRNALFNQLNLVKQEQVELSKKIEQEYPEYHQLKYKKIDVKIEDVQQLLDEKTALLEYLISDKELQIFKIDKDGLTWHKEPLNADSLKTNIRSFHQVLSDYTDVAKNKKENYQNYIELAHWFYQKLLEPVVKAEDGIENLIIVSDGELGHLPFESFLIEPAPKAMNYGALHYLLKDYKISYNYSAALWKENKEQPKKINNRKMLAFAANYEGENEENLMRGRQDAIRAIREGLQALPAARKEVEALEEAYQGFFAFDSLASERELKEMMEEYAIVHFAMHGLLNESKPMLSSLALTEDGDSLEDNFWQAHEIAKVKLNADLVVLSACETGYGRFEAGNGIASLARAFMYAGAPALVVSLWQVNDASTSIIMQNFYKYLADGQTKSEALRQAKLDYIEFVKDKNAIAAHPAFWSPFILIGDESPVKIQRKGANSWIWWAVGAGALLFGAIGFEIARRKQAG